MGLELDVEAPTVPPPDPGAKALGAISNELDILGDLAAETAAKLQTLADFAQEDRKDFGKVLAALGRIEQVLAQGSDRLAELESWRGEHERQHARQ